MKLKHISFSLLAFIFSIFITSLLFFKLYEFNQQKDYYHTYNETINKLSILDIEINSILDQKLIYLNFDNLNKKLQSFNTNITKLQKNKINNILKIDTDTLYKELIKNFNLKYELSEDFKSSNSSMINSLHYLFDIEKKLQEDKTISFKAKKSLSNILFLLMNTSLNLDIEYTFIHNKIKDLHDQKISHPYIKNFLNHAKHVLNKIQDLHDIENKIFSLPIEKNILKVYKVTETYYAKEIFKQKISVLLVFVLLLISIIVIYLLYRRIEATFLELSAFKYAVEHSDNTVVITDPDRNITYANDVFAKTTGYDVDQALGVNPSILKSGLMDENFYKDLNKTLDRGEKWQGEFINKRKDGSLYYEKASIVPIFIKGELISYLAIKLDITQYVKLKEELQQSAAVFEHTTDGIMITNAKGIITSVNKAMIKMSGYTESELIGQNPNLLRSGQQDKSFYKNMWKSINKTGNWKGKIFNQTKQGMLTQTWLSISTVKDEKDKVLNYIAIHTDLNELILIQDKVNYIAHHDSLTDLPNRRFLEEKLDEIINISSRDKQSFSVIFLDLDRFKIINDTLGHDIGDELLKIVSKRIKDTLRKTDTLARMGGDEFIIISQNIKNKEEPAHISQKILDFLTQPINIKNHQLDITASIGISIFPDDGKNISTLIKHADSAMYLAKDLGKNNFQYFTEQLSIDIHNRLKLEQSLRKALEKNELYLNFQPQYDLKTRKVIAAEALVRWNNDKLGFIPPDKFIPVTEETGLIIPIGAFIFEESCKAFMQWKEEGLNIDTIAINVSSIQLSQKDILDSFKDIIQRVKIPAENIEIEITERYLFDYTENESTILNDLRSLGFKISIDDFGTGYSSMSYLKKLPLDTIKIDKSFIDDIPTDANDVAITKAIMALSTSLGYLNVAEGIETVEQEDFLREHGCQIGQGYYFQRPIPNEEFISFCKKQI